MKSVLAVPVRVALLALLVPVLVLPLVVAPLAALAPAVSAGLLRV